MGRVKEYYFEEISRYPIEPGFKEPTTSREAAKAISGRTGLLRESVLTMLRLIGPMTADECASRLHETVLAIRPRFSELLKLELIERTGERRVNASGVKAAVWRAK